MEKVDNFSKVAHTGTESTVVTDTMDWMTDDTQLE